MVVSLKLETTLQIKEVE